MTEPTTRAKQEKDDDEPYGEPCFVCGDDGYIYGECFEDSCSCADPDSDHDLEPCPNCNASGARPETPR